MCVSRCSLTSMLVSDGEKVGGQTKSRVPGIVLAAAAVAAFVESVASSILFSSLTLQPGQAHIPEGYGASDSRRKQTFQRLNIKAR